MIYGNSKKLPSGSWRVQVFDHKDSTGKRHYKSFTSDDPSPAGKREAEFAAAQFMLNKDKAPSRKRQDYGNLTLTEAIDKYIESRVTIGRSPTTIQEYRCTQKNGFQDIMDMKLSDLDEDLLQEAITMEAQRTSNGRNRCRPISAKRLKNEWGLISSVLHKYRKDFIFSVELPGVPERIPELLPAETVVTIIKGTEIELAVLLAAWLSFSMSEVRGLTKSKSINGNYISIREVVVDIGGKAVRKDIAKNKYRNRTHRIPPYIKSLINRVDGDILVPMNGRILYQRWIRLLDDNNLQHMTFHDLRHLNASVMALLRVPDKYAQERGGWKSDKVMKKVYTQTFPEERVKVDDTVDKFFENIVEPEQDGLDREKYNAWLTLFNLTDSPFSKKQFKKFMMQHEMQHEKERAL